MTAKELIEKLQDMPPDVEAVSYVEYGDWPNYVSLQPGYAVVLEYWEESR